MNTRKIYQMKKQKLYPEQKRFKKIPCFLEEGGSKSDLCGMASLGLVSLAPQPHVLWHLVTSFMGTVFTATELYFTACDLWPATASLTVSRPVACLAWTDCCAWRSSTCCWSWCSFSLCSTSKARTSGGISSQVLLPIWDCGVDDVWTLPCSRGSDLSLSGVMLRPLSSPLYLSLLLMLLAWWRELSSTSFLLKLPLRFSRIFLFGSPWNCWSGFLTEWEPEDAGDASSTTVCRVALWQQWFLVEDETVLEVFATCCDCKWLSLVPSAVPILDIRAGGVTDRVGSDLPAARWQPQEHCILLSCCWLEGWHLAWDPQVGSSKIL